MDICNRIPRRALVFVAGLIFFHSSFLFATSGTQLLAQCNSSGSVLNGSSFCYIGPAAPWGPGMYVVNCVTGSAEGDWRPGHCAPYAAISCDSGHVEPGGSFDTSSILSSGDKFCANGCTALYHPPPVPIGPSVTTASICYSHPGGGVTCVTNGTFTDDGTACTVGGGGSSPPDGPPPAPSPPTVCGAASCYDPGPPAQLCQIGSANCVPAPPDAAAGSCSSSSSSVLCGGDNHGSPPPLPPDPPINPNTPPTTIDNYTITVINPGGTTTTTTEPAQTFTPPPGGSTGGQCPPGQALVNGSCAAPSSGSSSGVSGPPALCANGSPPGVSGCTDGSGPTCPGGGLADASGHCPGSVSPVACANGQVVAGACYCASGTVFNGAGCVGASGGTGSNGNPSNPGNGTCDGPSPPPQCKDTASGGGDCGTPPSCSGDQVLCNIAYQTWRNSCPGKLPGSDPADYLNAQPADGSALITSGGNGADGHFDSSGFLGGSGSCIQLNPINVAFGSQSVSLDISNDSWCLVSQMLGALVMLMAYFKAAQIVMRG